MADEVQPTLGIRYESGTGTTKVTHRRTGTAVPRTQTATKMTINKGQSIATSSTALDKSSISENVGYIWFKNLDATNFVEYSEDGTKWFMEVGPGEEAQFPTNAATVYLKADTGACLVAYELYAV